MGAVGVLGLAGQARVGDDAGDGVLELLGAAEQREGVVVALRHLAAIETGQGGDAFLDDRLGQGEVVAPVAEQVIEALTDVASHLHVLDLIAPDRHAPGVEHENVRSHQHRIAVEAHGDPGIGILALLQVAVDRGLVGMGAIEQALAGDAGEQPGQFGDLGDVGLAIEGHPLRIQAAGQPGGGDLQARTLDARRVVALDQGMVVGEEIEGVGIVGQAGADGGTDGPGIVA